MIRLLTSFALMLLSLYLTCNVIMYVESDRNLTDSDKLLTTLGLILCHYIITYYLSAKVRFSSKNN